MNSLVEGDNHPYSNINYANQNLYENNKLKNWICQVPQRIICNTFLYLSDMEFKKCREICKEWKQIANNKILFYKVANSQPKQNPCPFYKTFNFKPGCAAQYIYGSECEKIPNFLIARRLLSSIVPKLGEIEYKNCDRVYFDRLLDVGTSPNDPSQFYCPPHNVFGFGIKISNGPSQNWKYCYHTTRFSYLENILTKGFNCNKVVFGATFGNGVYTTPSWKYVDQISWGRTERIIDPETGISHLASCILQLQVRPQSYDTYPASAMAAWILHCRDWPDEEAEWITRLSNVQDDIRIIRVLIALRS